MDSNDHDDSGATSPKFQARPLWRVIMWPVLILLATLVVWILVVNDTTPPPTTTPAPPDPMIDSGRILREEFYSEKIEPLLKATERANREAAEQAIVRISEVFDKYLGGVKPFVNDITSIGTRFGIVTRMPSNWWYEDDRINTYVREKFERHLFSENQVHADLTKVLEAFKEDLRANENRLLASCKAAVEAGDLPDMALPDYKRYEDEVRTLILQFSGDRAKDSVYQGVATLVLSAVAEISAQQIIVRILVSVGTTATTSAAAGGGATAGGAVAGGGVGLVGGPVVTAIGAGVGLVIGVIVDWWMTERFQAQLTADLIDYIENLRRGLLDGTDSDSGLKSTLLRFTDDVNFAQTTVAHQALVGGER
jgi:hypothetical protein